MVYTKVVSELRSWIWYASPPIRVESRWSTGRLRRGATW